MKINLNKNHLTTGGVSITPDSVSTSTTDPGGRQTVRRNPTEPSSAKTLNRKAPDATGVTSIRLPRHMFYFADLAARSQGRSMGNFFEEAIREKLARTMIAAPMDPDREYLTYDPVFQEALWDVDEADRLVRLALFMPLLMDFDEQRVWKSIKTQPELYASTNSESANSFKGWNLAKIREDWETLKITAIANRKK